MSSHGTAISKILSEAYGQLGYVHGVFSFRRDQGLVSALHDRRVGALFLWRLICA
jgi:hypothetical protein